MHLEKMRLKKLNNTRDLGGFPTADGRKIKRGKLIRSGRLYKLPESTVAALEKMHITTIIDMRIERERLDYPCTQINGARQVLLPLVCTATTGITHTKSMAKTMLDESKRIKTEFGNADNYMASIYSHILFDDESQEKLKEFFGLVKADEHCILWHCNAGKDRTGICAMLLESVLGVSEELIVKDYCASKTFQRKKRRLQKWGLFIAPVPRKFKQILYALMDAKPQYITGAIREIEARYGSVTGSCKSALGLTDEDITFLKDKYLE